MYATQVACHADDQTRVRLFPQIECFQSVASGKISASIFAVSAFGSRSDEFFGMRDHRFRTRGAKTGADEAGVEWAVSDM
jgi:hypothetical protein